MLLLVTDGGDGFSLVPSLRAGYANQDTAVRGVMHPISWFFESSPDRGVAVCLIGRMSNRVQLGHNGTTSKRSVV